MRAVKLKYDQSRSICERTNRKKNQHEKTSAKTALFNSIYCIRINRHTSCLGNIAYPFSVIKINFLLVISMLHETVVRSQ